MGSDLFEGAAKLQCFTSSGLSNLSEMLLEGFLSCCEATAVRQPGKLR